MDILNTASGTASSADRLKELNEVEDMIGETMPLRALAELRYYKNLIRREVEDQLSIDGSDIFLKSNN